MTMIQNALFPGQTRFAITAVQQLCTKIALFKQVPLPFFFSFFFFCFLFSMFGFCKKQTRVMRFVWDSKFTRMHEWSARGAQFVQFEMMHEIGVMIFKKHFLLNFENKLLEILNACSVVATRSWICVLKAQIKNGIVCTWLKMSAFVKDLLLFASL